MADRSAYIAWADSLGFEAQPRPWYGLTDPSIAGLRAFKAFHKDAMDPVEIAGRTRLLSHKQLAMYGLFSRLAVTGERTTMTAIAKEAHVVPSTVSRFVLKLQVWEGFAIDVIRGRNGGVRVRTRSLYDGLAAYAVRAWERVRKASEKALSRTKIKVASIFPLTSEGYNGADNDLLTSVVLMDATFSEAFDEAERNGRLLAAERAADKTPSLPRQERSGDHEFVPGNLTAENIIAERVRLAIFDPSDDPAIAAADMKLLRWYHGIQG